MSVVLMAQPLYGFMSAAGHGHSMEFLGYELSRGRLHGYIARPMAYIDDARNGLVELTLTGYCDPSRPVSTHATHIFLADQDMLFPFDHPGQMMAGGKVVDTLGMLLEHDADVATGIYWFKDGAPNIMAWETLGTPEPGKKADQWRHPPKFLSDFDPNGSQQVAGGGLGCCLIKVDVFRRMAKHYGDKEWFRSERGGEDFHFFCRCREMGIKVILDGRVRPLHLGEYPFGYENWKNANAKNPNVRRDHFLKRS